MRSPGLRQRCAVDSHRPAHAAVCAGAGRRITRTTFGLLADPGCAVNRSRSRAPSLPCPHGPQRDRACGPTRRWPCLRPVRTTPGLPCPIPSGDCTPSTWWVRRTAEHGQTSARRSPHPGISGECCGSIRPRPVRLVLASPASRATRSRGKCGPTRSRSPGSASSPNVRRSGRSRGDRAAATCSAYPPPIVRTPGIFSASRWQRSPASLALPFALVRTSFRGRSSSRVAHARRVVIVSRQVRSRRGTCDGASPVSAAM